MNATECARDTAALVSDHVHRRRVLTETQRLELLELEEKHQAARAELDRCCRREFAELWQRHGRELGPGMQAALEGRDNVRRG